jgi:hypothetical protein
VFNVDASGSDTLTATDIVMKMTANASLRFFLKGGGGERWIEYPLVRKTVAYDPSFADSTHNLDSWNFERAYECSRSGTVFTRILQICVAGSWETAILESGAADFVGSHAHGDEVLTATIFLVDGVLADLATTADRIGKTATFIQKSILYRCNTMTPIANYTRRYDFNHQGVVLTHDLEWIEGITIIDSYLTMLPIARLDGATQITDSGLRNPGYSIEDLSIAGFPSVTTNNTTKVNIWGATSGISAEVELLEFPVVGTREFNFSPSDLYNKLYFDTSSNYITTPGEVWRQKARYQITTRN